MELFLAGGAEINYALNSAILLSQRKVTKIHNFVAKIQSQIVFPPRKKGR